MREVLGRLSEILHAGQPVAYCRLVETRGSTPQKAGAAMLVLEDGSQVGTLGGGCVEAEVKRRALDVLFRGEPQICTFTLDHDYGWDDGLICGGRMQILVEPLRGQVPEYFAKLEQLAAAGAGFTEAIVLDAAASGLPVAASFLFDSEGRLCAVRHCDEDQRTAAVISEQLKPLAERPRPYAARGIGYLPTFPRCRLIIVGAGHVGQAVARLAADLDFDVWVVDDREEYANRQRFPQAQRLICGRLGDVLEQLEITRDTFCVIVTRGHSHDEEALYHLAERGARYVGMIGSRRKIKMIFEDLLDAGVSPEALARVYAPLGIDIGSQTVAEIAVSVCAELVAVRNRGVVPGRPEPVLVQRGAS